MAIFFFVVGLEIKQEITLTLTAHHSPLNLHPHRSPLTTHHSPLTTHHSTFTLTLTLTTQPSPLTAHRSPLTFHPIPKQEMRLGSLSSVKKALLPCIAAVGGMI
eukprot:scaffold91525_cov36-Phaeocystis_antarctica.AAC.1